MAVRQNLYRIYKLNASEIASAPGLDVGKLAYQKAVQRKEVVTIGDNMVFAEIRSLKGDARTPDDIYSLILSMRRGMRRHKMAGRRKEASIVNAAIDQLLFVPEIVDVIVDAKKSDFDAFRVRGFDLNGAHYEYLCSGAGQIRRNTATFIDSRIRDSVVRALNCGLDEKTKEFPLAKYTAYFALSFSSVLWVREPRVCVIKDFSRTAKDQKVDFIVRDEAGNLTLEHRTMDLDLNCADGQGLIDPEFAKLWAEDMGVGYQPCSFVVRSCFVKGNLATFDFKAYAAEHGITEIFDRWGAPHDIDDVDVLISESQFKTYKYYSSWEEYLAYAHRGNVRWGVARYNKKRDDAYVLANYQYIQALTLSEEDVEGLIKPTADWIRSICTGEDLPALLFMLGAQDECLNPEELFADQMKSAKTAAMRCLAKDSDFLKDEYVRRRIYKAIKGIIKRAKLGKIWIHGNYQFTVSDPVAQCQSALGLEPVGLLKAGEIYCNWWNQNGSPKDLILCRSPLIDQSETKKEKLVSMEENPEAAKWYLHLPSGLVYNTYDDATVRQSDFDFDGDIILSTDNPYFLKGSHPEMPAITYEKGKAGPAPMTVANITKTAEKGFGTGVGGFSNCATCLYAMASEFQEGDPRREEILGRIKKLREIVGQEIDRIKGADKPHLPREWKEMLKIDENDDDETKKAKYRHNSLVVSKKPYFFRYLYPALDEQWKRYEDAYNQVSRAQFGLPIKGLMAKPNKTQDETNLIRRYRKYAPLITSNCTMNRLCRAFEREDFDIKFAKPAPNPDGSRGKPTSMLPDYPKAYPADPKRIAQLRSIYRLYKKRRRKKAIEAAFMGMDIPESAQESYQDALSLAADADMDEARSLIGNMGMGSWELCTLCHRMAERDPSFDWSFAWDMGGDDLAEWVPQGKALCAVRTPDGDREILGERYSLSECSDRCGAAIDRLAEAFLGEGGGKDGKKD